MSTFVAIPNGHIAFTDDNGVRTDYASNDYIIEIVDATQVAIRGRLATKREKVLVAANVTAPSGAWTPETLANKLNREPFFFQNPFRVTFEDSLIDAGGRLRTSELNTLGDYKILNGFLDTNFLEEAGTGTGTVNTNSYSMSVTAGQWKILNTKQYHPYLNGKCQDEKITIAGFGAATGVAKRFGYYSSSATSPYDTAYDGFMLNKDVSDAYSLDIWRNGTMIGSVARDDWYDRLDGGGPSGMNIDWDNFNVYEFDFLYLGGTTVRAFVEHNGKTVLFALFHYANTDTEPIWHSPNKPVRWEIRSTTGSGSMLTVCATVSSEGSIDKLGGSITINNIATGIVAAAVGTTYALVGVRKKTTHRDIFALVHEYAAICSTINDIVEVALYLNPTVAGVFTYADIANSPLQSAIGVATNTVTGGTKIHSSYSAQNQQTSRQLENILQRLNSTLNDTMDTIVLGVTPVLGSPNAEVTGGIQVRWLN